MLLVSFGFAAGPGMAARAAGPCDSDWQGPACLDAMAANATPAVAPIEVDSREVGAYSFFKVLPDTMRYDAPNGNPVGAMDNGFTFVIVRGVKDGFAQLRDGTWVKRTQLKQTYASMFSGVAVNDLPYPMAWIIQAVLPSPAPGAANSTKTPAIKRYTRVYIYATQKVGQWDWYLVGPGQWVEQRKVARVVPVARPADSTDKWVNVNLYEQVLTAYEGDKLVFATLISSGLPNFQTNAGTFKVWSRQKSTPMSGAMGEPDFYSLPAVPYVMFFDNDISLHGTYWHDGFGFKHSHGCVNMTISDAKWVFNWQGDGDLTVNVTLN
jgi:lipoprotein-anchoring transpeptidase ErfK/SrfK